MATTTSNLTPRQQEIQKLLDGGNTPREIAKKLKITENAIYQQLRRIRQANGEQKPSRPSRSRSRSKSRSRSSTATASSASPAATMTPLQAIRHRRSEIESKLSESLRELERAQSTLAKAQDVFKVAKDKTADELKALELAERAIKGDLPKTARRRSNDKGQASEPAATANGSSAEPVAPPEAPAPDATPEASADGGEERPGVPTVPEFEQGNEAAAAFDAE